MIYLENIIIIFLNNIIYSGKPHASWQVKPMVGVPPPWGFTLYTDVFKKKNRLCQLQAS
jgi:hypothetical protein